MKEEKGFECANVQSTCGDVFKRQTGDVAGGELRESWTTIEKPPIWYLNARMIFFRNKSTWAQDACCLLLQVSDAYCPELSTTYKTEARRAHYGRNEENDSEVSEPTTYEGSWQR